MQSELKLQQERELRKRKREKVAIISLFFLFFLLLFVEIRIGKVSSSLPFVNSIFFFGLMNLNIIILTFLLWLVIRNVGKMILERRRNVLGSRLKTKLVISFLGFSIFPTVVLFVISALYINTSFDKWFSLKIQNTLEAALEITRSYYRGADEQSTHFATFLGQTLEKRKANDQAWSPPRVQSFLEQQRAVLALDFVEYYSDPLLPRLMSGNPGLLDLFDFSGLSLQVLDDVFSGKSVTTLEHVGVGDLVRVAIPIRAKDGEIDGVVVVSRYIPVTLANKVDEIATVIGDYKDINPLKYPVKTAYLLILVLVTLGLIFLAIWGGIYVARELSVPVERLVRGAEAVSSGDLDVVVEAKKTDDEIGVLVDRFNVMTSDLRENRKKLYEVNQDLERQRNELRAILTNIATGVVALDKSGIVTSFNAAAEKILELSADSLIGKNMKEAFPLTHSELVKAFEDALQSSTLEIPELSIKLDENSKSLSLTSTRVPGGVVIVLDDVTNLVRAQREMAWREVARRVAHEIKNPLTPIKLSAQRLQRRLADLAGREGQILRECTEVIIQHTDELKELTNEFSNFARMPEVSMARGNLREIARSVFTLYQQAHLSLEWEFLDAENLPEFDFDRDQIRRVLINLLDNAVTALEGSSKKGKISVDLSFYQDLKIAVIEVSDNGPGIPEETLERVFEPNFSTKVGGMGLGLAIVKRIVSDHHGFIRVKSEVGHGTSFSIELPTVTKSHYNKA